MSQENVERACRFYAALNDVYRSGDVDDLRPLADELWDPEIILRPSGRLPEVGEWHGHDGVVRFVAGQMEAFTQMWFEVDEFIDAGDKVVLAGRFGGHARHTGIDVEFRVAHVISMHAGRATRIDIYQSKAEALEAAGLSEQDAHADS
jgi:ketosteroid isomerase-like protein